jgi:K+-sensing histidine kinase KdpD
MRLAHLHPPRTIPDDQRSTVVAYAAIVPLLVCSTVAAAGVRAPQTTAVLLVVLVIVAAAATGLRSAGLTATVSGTLCFDYFLTEPTHSLAISGAQAVQTALLLLVVGAAITEIAQRHATSARTTAQDKAGAGAPRATP